MKMISMNDISLTNNHLLDVCEHLNLYLEKEEAPDDLLISFSCELYVSNLIVPAIVEDEKFIFENITLDDGKSYLPLFTDIAQYARHEVEANNSMPLVHDFEIYDEILKKSNLDGILINMDSDCIKIPKDIIADLIAKDAVRYDEDTEPYTVDEIMEIYDNISNDDLVEFLKSEEITSDELFAHLSKSYLLNVVFSDDPLDEYLKDGVIMADDVDGFDLCTVQEEGINFAAVFTSKESVQKALNKDADITYYGQVTILSELFDFVLENDMDGVIIDPNSTNFIIKREELHPQATGVDLIVEDSRIRDSLQYAFEL